MIRLFAATLGVVFLHCASPAALTAGPLKLGSTGAAAGLLQRLADSFAAQASQHEVETIPGLGSAGSIAAVAAGAIDLAISSRDINDKEKAQGVASVPLFETPYIFVSSSAAPLSLSHQDVLGYYAGTTRSYPNGESIRLILRPRSDANSLYITSAIPGMMAAQEQARLRHDLPVAGTDQDNMQHLKSIAGAFSGLTLTQLSTEPNTLQRVRLNNVEGTIETMNSGAYPHRMMMFIITGKSTGPVARAFLAYVASPEGQRIIEKAGGQPVQH